MPYQSIMLWQQLSIFTVRQFVISSIHLFQVCSKQWCEAGIIKLQLCIQDRLILVAFLIIF